MDVDTAGFPAFRPGQVWLVGAGPGDPRHLTLLALHALRSADCVIHDALVGDRILALVREDCERIPAGKRGGKPSALQADINQRIIAEARRGRRVLRLKGGDPFLFGRGGEEALALAEASIPFRIVPGVTAGLAAMALIGIPATSRATNHAIVLAAGQRALDSEAMSEWEALGRAGQPLVLYMAMPQLEQIAAALQRGGLPGETPTTIIASASLPDERVVETRLADAARVAAVEQIGAPTIVVVGSIAELRAPLIASLLCD